MTEARVRRQYYFYSPQYARFESDIAVEIRREVDGEDQGQQGWRTLDEQDQIADLIGPAGSCHILNIACGSGGPSLALVASTDCTLTGIDNEPFGIERAQRLAAERGLSDKAHFVTVDCRNRLPFEDEAFDVVVCIDAVLHLGDRLATLADWTGAPPWRSAALHRRCRADRSRFDRRTRYSGLTGRLSARAVRAERDRPGCCRAHIATVR